MASKSASIKLTLDAGGLKSGLKDAEKAGEGAAKGIGASFSKALTAGVKGGVDSIKGAFSSIKSTLLSISGIAGGVGIAELARGSLQTEGTFRKLAFSINAGTHAGVGFKGMLIDAQKTALDTGHTTDELGKTMQAVFSETGNAEFTQKAIGAIATAATGAHEPLETMGAIAGTLNKKFGVTADQIGATLATVVGLGNKGGVTVGEMGEKLSLIGAFAKEAGMSGQEGFAQMMGMMNIADQSTGTLKKGISAVGGILEVLGTTASRTKALMQLGIDPSKAKGDVKTTIGQILQATKGNKDALSKVFGGEQGKVMVDLGKTYAAAFNATTGDVKTKTAAGLAAFNAAIDKAGATGTSYADLQKEAGAEMQTAEGRMKTALNKLQAVFTSDKMQAALDKLFAVLPKLADMLASVAGFAIDHPGAAAGIAVAGIGAKGALGAASSSLLEAAIKGALGAGGKTAGSAITGAMTSAAPSLGSAIGGGIAAAGIGFAIGSMITSALEAYDNRAHTEEAGTKGVDQDTRTVNDYSIPGIVRDKKQYATDLKDEKGNFTGQRSWSDTQTMKGGGLAGILSKLPGGEEAVMGTGTGKRMTEKQLAAQPSAMTPAAMQAAMTAAVSRKLLVEVTNPEAMRGGAPGAAGGSPVPGNQPRR